MSSQAFEILCPICRSAVPPDASGCPSCARTKGEAAALGTKTVAPNAADRAAPDYHRVVRATYQATERPGTGSSRMRPYLPFALLVLLLAAGAVVLFGHL